MVPRTYAVIGVAIIAASIGLGAYAFWPQPGAVAPAPPFQLVDTEGTTLNSTSLTSQGRLVVLDFGGVTCKPCKYVEESFRNILYPQYSATVTFISVFEPPLNDPTSLRDYRATHNMTWHLTADTDTLEIRYNVPVIPRIFVIDKNGYVAFDWQASPTLTSSAPITTDVGGAIQRVIAGTSGTVNVTAISIPALLVVAALLSFFSPCSFPVLPAFMSFYMNLDAKGGSDPTKKPTARTAAVRGFVASLGMVAVYGIIAGVVLAAGLAAQGVIPFISPVVGAVLIAMAVLTLLPYQYHFLTRPFIALKKRIAAKLGGSWTPGVRTKLFAFGAGYGAAGFACVAPPFIGAMLNASAIGAPDQALLGLALYVVVVVVTMILVVVGLHVAGDRLLKKIRVWSAAIKYVSAAALMLAGGYLLWVFATTYR